MRYLANAEFSLVKILFLDKSEPSFAMQVARTTIYGVIAEPADAILKAILRTFTITGLALALNK